MINIDPSLLVTVLYVIILYIFLNYFFFGPVSSTLAKRRELIDGRLEDARKRMELVEQRSSEYEQALKVARTEAYRKQEQERELALAEKTNLISEARKQADKTLTE